MTPTEAERRAQAREIAHGHLPCAELPDREPDAHSGQCHTLTYAIDAALAAAREQALEECARYFEEAADFDAGPITRLVVAASIRALSKLEQSHGK